MTEISTLKTTPELKTLADKPATILQVLYYLSFIIIYFGLYFIAVLYLMDYEQKYATSNWANQATMVEKACLIISTILQFPFALLVGQFTNNDTAWILGLLLNALLLGFTIDKFLLRSKRKALKKASIINYIIVTLLILTISIILDVY